MLSYTMSHDVTRCHAKEGTLRVLTAKNFFCPYPKSRNMVLFKFLDMRCFAQYFIRVDMPLLHYDYYCGCISVLIVAV